MRAGRRAAFGAVMADHSKNEPDAHGSASRQSKSDLSASAGRSQSVGSFRDDLTAELQEQLAFTENGHERKISKQRAIIRTLVEAATTNIKAINVLLACMRAFGAGAEERTAEKVDVEDLDLLETYLAQQRKQQDRSALNPKSDKPKTSRLPRKRK
jgi:hypothetical protein